MSYSVQMCITKLLSAVATFEILRWFKGSMEIDPFVCTDFDDLSIQPSNRRFIAKKVTTKSSVTHHVEGTLLHKNKVFALAWFDSSRL